MSLRPTGVFQRGLIGSRALGFAHQDAGKMHRASGWKKRVASPDVHSASPCAGSVVSEDLSGFKESLPSKPIKPPPWA